MTWTYSGDPSTSPKDHIRFLLGDVIEADPLLQDMEIQFVLDANNGNTNNTFISLGDNILARLAREVDYKIGPESVTASQRYENFKDNFQRVKANLIVGSGRPEASVSGPSVFGVGLHDWR